MKEIKAIPTIYKCIQFRSRLEATWAAFFDNLGWRWEYEPTDFNGWIPDFALFGEDIIYVEVKPVIKFPAEIAREIDTSGCDKEVLIMGLSPAVKGDYNQECLGWLKDSRWECGDWGAATLLRCDKNGIWGFCHETHSYTDRISGTHGELRDVDFEEVFPLWSAAKNLTQWNAPKTIRTFDITAARKKLQEGWDNI